MESNNSSSNTAAAGSSDPPPPNQRNDDKGKQTCSNESEANNNPDSSVLKTGKKRRATSNESEVNENKNNNPETSAGKKRKSSSNNDGVEYMGDDVDLKFLPDGFIEKEPPWNNDQCYSEPQRMEHLVSGDYDSLNDFKGLDPTEDIQMSFADDEEGPPQPSGGSSSQQLFHHYHLTKAENQTVANSEGLFGYYKPLMEHSVSGNDTLKDSKALSPILEDVEMSSADEDPAGGSSSQQLHHDYHPF